MQKSAGHGGKGRKSGFFVKKYQSHAQQANNTVSLPLVLSSWYNKYVEMLRGLTTLAVIHAKGFLNFISCFRIM